MAHSKPPRRRTLRRARLKAKMPPRRRRDARSTPTVGIELAVPDNEFVHNDDWLEPYEPNEEAP